MGHAGKIATHVLLAFVALLAGRYLDRRARGRARTSAAHLLALSARWQMRQFMFWWSGLVLLLACNFTLAVVMRKMSVEAWRDWFGWLPSF